MRVEMVIVSANQTGRKASARQSRRGGSGTKAERKRDYYYYVELW